jgi:hypothetical protein
LQEITQFNMHLTLPFSPTDPRLCEALSQNTTETIE